MFGGSYNVTTDILEDMGKPGPSALIMPLVLNFCYVGREEADPA